MIEGPDSTLRILYYLDYFDSAYFGGDSRVVIDLVLDLIINSKEISVYEARVLSLSISSNSISLLKGFTAISANSSYSASIDIPI